MKVQVAFDSADPNTLADFWVEVLGYEVEDNTAFVDQLVADGRMLASDRIVIDGHSRFREVAAIVDPTGEGPRFFFQLVPEGKTAKNRVHVDVSTPEEKKQAEVERLTALGARLLWVTSDRGPTTYTMQDPEGNEFCLH